MSASTPSLDRIATGARLPEARGSATMADSDNGKLMYRVCYVSSQSPTHPATEMEVGTITAPALVSGWCSMPPSWSHGDEQ